jgi:hypothetical protein
MLDKSIEALEVTVGGETLFVEGQDKQDIQTLVRTWSKRGSLLTLTATEAVQCNIANKIVSSQRELLAALNAVKAGLVRNNDSEKAKRQFEQVKRDFKVISSAVTYFKDRSEELQRELNWLERLTRSRGPLYGYGSYWHERDMIEQIRLRNELLSTLDRLILNYQRAINLAKEYLDLNADIDSLVDGMNSAIAEFEEIQRRPPL